VAAAESRKLPYVLSCYTRFTADIGQVVLTLCQGLTIVRSATHPVQGGTTEGANVQGGGSTSFPFPLTPVVTHVNT